MSSYRLTPFICFQKWGIKEDFQGLRNPRKRSLLDVNEYFKDEYNAENTFYTHFLYIILHYIIIHHKSTTYIRHRLLGYLEALVKINLTGVMIVAINSEVDGIELQLTT